MGSIRFWQSLLIALLCSLTLQVKERGGDCLPVVCDSSKEDDIKQLFEQIKHEQKGRLDILVNNAYAGVQVGVGQCRDTVCLYIRHSG